MRLTLDDLRQQIENLADNVPVSSSCDPITNTSLTNQINQEIVDLHSYTQHVIALEGKREDEKKVLLIKRLAQAQASIETETEEANAGVGARRKAIFAIYTQLLLSTEYKQAYDNHYHRLRFALLSAKNHYYRTNALGLHINSKVLAHPYRSFKDAGEMRSIKAEYSLLLNEEKVTTLDNDKKLIEIPVDTWGLIKYQAIAKSIEERIKLKLFGCATIIGMWSIHHFVAGGIDGAIHAGEHAVNHHMLATENGASSSCSAGKAIASALGACVTAVGGILSVCCDNNAGCDNCCSGCGNVVCNCLGSVPNAAGTCCNNTVDCVGNCGSDCCNTTSNVCCAPDNNIIYINNSSSSCNYPSCNPFEKRNAHSESNISAAYETTLPGSGKNGALFASYGSTHVVNNIDADNDDKSRQQRPLLMS